MRAFIVSCVVGMAVVWIGLGPTVLGAQQAGLGIGGAQCEQCTTYSCDSQCNASTFGACTEVKFNPGTTCHQSSGDSAWGCQGGPHGVTCQTEKCSDS